MRKRESHEFKKSDTEWPSEEMPVSWDRLRLKNVLANTTSGSTPASGDDTYYSEDEKDIPWVSIGDLGENFTYHTKIRVTQKAIDDCRLTVVPAGTLLYSMYASVGFVSELAIQATTNQAILSLYLDESKCEKTFIKYWLKNMRYHVGRITSTSTQSNLNANKVKNLELYLPAIVEQRRIVNYLDAETNKIDNLCSELIKFKGHLHARRKSLISECVTKGIPEDRDREYKDSGIEWLGEIPEEWGLRPFGKSVVLISKKIKTTQNRISLDMIQSGNGALSINDENDFVGDGVAFAGGDVLFGKLRPYLNKSYYAESDGDAFGDIHVYRPNEDVAGKYLFYFTLMDGFVKEANRTASGVKMPRASWSNITKFAFTLPSLAEQQIIAEYLDFECVKIESLTGEIDNQISLLKTYRKSLINEVVTGKVEV